MKTERIRHNQVGGADHGWLKAKHYFSFANYYNPSRMGFGALRVINDDLIAAGTGFGTHPHRDMEIITIPLSGGVRHQDSAGHSGVVGPGEVQVMSAGSGIAHSEYNHSKEEPLSLFQIWIEPNKLDVKPRYDQKSFADQKPLNEWVTLVNPMGEISHGGLEIHQDAYLSRVHTSSASKVTYNLKKTRNGIFLLLVSGQIEIQGQVLETRDALQVSEVSSIEIHSHKDSEVLVIEVPLTDYR